MFDETHFLQTINSVSIARERLAELERSASVNDKPWLVPAAIEWLDHYLTKDMRAFEWGMGGSTLWYARRVKELISVEHDLDWHKAICLNLANSQIKNVMPLFYPLNNGYVEAIELSREYDYIAVDGRNRVKCIAVAIPRLKRGGVLLLDNSERAEYKPGIDLMRDWACFDFKNEWQTSVYIRP